MCESEPGSVSGGTLDPFGTIFFFERNGTTWSPGVKHLASNGFQYDYFGIAVQIQGDWAAASTLWGHGTYLFKHDGNSWVEKTILPEQSSSLSRAAPS